MLVEPRLFAQGAARRGAVFAVAGVPTAGLADGSYLEGFPGKRFQVTGTTRLDGRTYHVLEPD